MTVPELSRTLTTPLFERPTKGSGLSKTRALGNVRDWDFRVGQQL
jgi:hypothetical protein